MSTATISVKAQSVASIQRHSDHVVIKHNSQRVVRLYYCSGKKAGLVRVDLSQVKDTTWAKAQHFIAKKGTCYYFPIEQLETAIRWWYND